MKILELILQIHLLAFTAIAFTTLIDAIMVITKRLKAYKKGARHGSR
jgi:hypothetical protein